MKRIIVAAVLLAVLGGAVWIQRTRIAPQPVAEGPRTTRVTRGTLLSSVSASGQLQPYAQAEVRSRATGTVVDLHVQEGDKVTKGQLLAVIDDRDARAGHETAQAQLAASTAKLASSQRTLAATHTQNLTRITQAEGALRTANANLARVLAGSRPEEIDQAREGLQQAHLTTDLARQNLDRTRDLFTQGLVSRQQLDQAQNQLDTAQAQVRAAQAKVREVQAGSTPQDIAVARSQMHEAESALATARAAQLQETAMAADIAAAAAQVRNSQAAVDQSVERVNESQVTAPIDGIVAKLAVQVGQSVIGGVSSGGTLVMTIADTRFIQADIQVDESDVAQVRINMPARITVDALPGRTFNGKVIRIAPQATITQNVTQFDVIVEIRDPDRLLRLGMSADAEFIITERQDVLLVPSEAVRGKDAKVVIVVEGEKLAPVVVEIGATDGRQVEIVRGLEAGQVVYLGPSRAAANGSPRTQQPVNPFQPQFQQRRTGPAGR